MTVDKYTAFWLDESQPFKYKHKHANIHNNIGSFHNADPMWIMFSTEKLLFFGWHVQNIKYIWTGSLQLIALITKMTTVSFRCILSCTTCHLFAPFYWKCQSSNFHIHQLLLSRFVILNSKHVPFDWIGSEKINIDWKRSNTCETYKLTFANILTKKKKTQNCNKVNRKFEKRIAIVKVIQRIWAIKKVNIT